MELSIIREISCQFNRALSTVYFFNHSFTLPGMLLPAKVTSQRYERQQIPSEHLMVISPLKPIADVFEANLSRYRAGGRLRHLADWGRGY